MTPQAGLSSRAVVTELLDESAGDSEQLMALDDALRAGGIRAPTWFPGVRRVVGESAGPHVGGGWKITHHTTEGSTAEGAIAAYRSHRGWPHFTAGWNGRRLQLIQHLPLEVGARALVNPPDAWETNRARTIQIEHVGFARNTGRWSAARYRAIADLCRWIETATGCPRAVMREVAFAQPHRLSPREFHVRAGHHGHVHVPGNTHTDPGTGFRIALVLHEEARAHRNFKAGVQGADVIAFQRAINRRARGCGRPDRRVEVDGIVGPQTLRNGAWAAWILGIGERKADNGRGGISARLQRLVRHPELRTDAQRERSRRRRRRHCNTV
jgi:hypothetical protein